MSGRPSLCTPDSRDSTTTYDYRMTASALNSAHRAFEPALQAGMTAEKIDQLLAFYDEPHRSYHSREHLREMLDAALEHELTLDAAQVLAILGHDAVYIPGSARGSNETMSAQLLKVYSHRVGRSTVDAAIAIIHDTIDHQPRHPRSAAVLDLDLMRLAATPAGFARYSREVFAEQRALIEPADDEAAWRLFDDRRTQFFCTMLERSRIYHLPQMHALFDEPCRRNLRQAVADNRSARRANPAS